MNWRRWSCASGGMYCLGLLRRPAPRCCWYCCCCWLSWWLYVNRERVPNRGGWGRLRSIESVPVVPLKIASSK